MKPKSLAEIQTAIQEAIRTKNLPSALLNEILEKPPISIATRLAIYQDAYFIRLSESLQEDFARTANALGGERFSQAVRSFIAARPSRVRDLAEYSQGFPEFLRAEYPEAHEASVRDWLQILTEDSTEPVQALTPSQIQSGQAFCLRRHPAVHIRDTGGSALASYSKADETRFLNLEKTEFALLQFLETPRSPEELAGFATHLEIVPSVLMEKLSAWMTLSILYCEEAKP